jgi:hypothetical protein
VRDQVRAGLFEAVDRAEVVVTSRTRTKTSRPASGNRREVRVGAR